MAKHMHQMSTIELYESLTKIEKAKLLWAKGVYLEERQHKGLIIQLYGLFGFYVEVFYNETGTTLKDLKPFDDVAKLGPYLDKIDISPLLTTHE